MKATDGIKMLAGGWSTSKFLSSKPATTTASSVPVRRIRKLIGNFDG